MARAATRRRKAKVPRAEELAVPYVRRLRGMTPDFDRLVLPPAEMGAAVGGVLPDWVIEQRLRLKPGDPRRLVIKPFSQAVKVKNKVSWGLSSYGYDLRLGRNYLVFNDVLMHEVDPLTLAKTIAARIKSGQFFEVRNVDSCVIPPNSFCLAESKEWFEIPRDCTTIVLGKCVAGDVKVMNPATGAYGPIVGRDAIGSVVSAAGPALCSELIHSGRQPVLRLQTKSGHVLRATASHPVRSEGAWVRMGDLRPGMVVTVATHLPFFGSGSLSVAEAQLLALMIADGQCHTPRSSPAYTKHDPVMADLLRSTAAGVLGCGVSGPNKNHRYLIVNSVGRGGVVTRNRCYEWLGRYGLTVGSHEKFIPQTVYEATRPVVAAFLSTLYSGDGSVYLTNKSARTPSVMLEYSSASRELADGVRHLLSRFGIVSTMSIKETTHRPAYVVRVMRKAEIARFFAEIGFVANSAKDKFYSTSVRQHLTHEVVAPEPFVDEQVTSVEPDGDAEVFDVEVPCGNNFVANGILPHNSTYARCGINLNMTPLEPGWRGIVTIEIGNMTRLPARVHSDQGIGQVLFFQGVAQCRKAYDEKKGKSYQNQTGLTLPVA